MFQVASSSAGTINQIKLCNEGDWEPDDSSLPKCVHKLPSAPGCATTYVIGTAHVSKKSVDQVPDVIEALRPDVILLEICSGRRQLLEHMDIVSVPTMSQMQEQLSGGADPFAVLYGWFLASVASNMEVTPGDHRVARAAA